MRALLFVLLLAGCQTITVKPPPCEPPPLPVEALVPCDPPEPIADGKMETLYLHSFVDAALIRDCRARFANLKAQIAYRDAKLKECQQATTKPEEKPWWK